MLHQQVTLCRRTIQIHLIQAQHQILNSNTIKSCDKGLRHTGNEIATLMDEENPLALMS